VYCRLGLTSCRYEIDGDKADWEEAEKRAQLAAKNGKANPLVSVKTNKAKRKASPEPAEKQDDRGHKKSKKAKRDKKDKKR
jgi:N-acetyltransferase 10